MAVVENAQQAHMVADSLSKWRHTIDLGFGVTTPGTEDCRAELARLSIPSRPDGQRVLDIKTYYRTDVRFWVKGRCLGFDIDRRPKWWYFPTTELAGDPTNWWAPNRSGLEAGLSSSGWSNFTHIGTWRDRLYYHAVRDE